MIRNRKFIPNGSDESSSSGANGELPIFNNGTNDNNGSAHNHQASPIIPGITTSRRRRRVPRSKNKGELPSAIVTIFAFFTLASLGIVGWNHVHPHEQHIHPFKGRHKVVGRMHRFLARSEDSVIPPENKLKDLAIEAAPSNVKYDIAILGAGPAGLSAAIYGARAGLQVVVLGSQVGLLSETPLLENFPGFYPYSSARPEGGGSIAYTGENWLKMTRNQAHRLGAHFAMPGLLAQSVEVKSEGTEKHFSISTQLDSFEAKSVIVATGATSRRLDLPHEETLWGKHLHNCAICDGPSYHGKNVVVIGGGDAAIDAAIYLSRQCQKVTLVHRQNTFDKAKALASLELVKHTPNIEILTPYVVQKWNTEKSNNNALDDEDLALTGVTLKNVETEQVQQISCDGAFLMIGATPNTDWISNRLALEENGLIRLNNKDGSSNTAGMVSATSVEGIFAAGEVIDAKYKQAITASAEGAQAALDAERWLRTQQNGPGTRAAAKMAMQDPVDNEQAQTQTEPEEERLLEGDDCNLTEKDCITRLVNKYPVVVFSKPWCPFCRKALEALAIAGLSKPYVVDLSQYPNAREIQSTYASMTGRRTVPNVFVGGTSIGGGDETVALQSAGKLRPLLIKVGAIDTEAAKPEVEASETIDLGPPPNGDYGCDLATLECIQDIVKKYPLVLFSLSWCPECHRMFELLITVGISNPHIIDLDEYKKNGTAAKIRASLVKLAKSNQVPSLFVGGEALGGYYKVLQLNQSQKLVPKLKAAGLTK
ncbi:unnamed protein product [Cylindrotheca closterium]|uniref:Thioredoxin reductase n=1 Tax=Cylindrotheca closterium TaxID=2856 RepID=A0AAD2FS15_9STRA|nr:unnamed protein product [Cylindrotheca closterium]